MFQGVLYVKKRLEKRITDTIVLVTTYKGIKKSILLISSSLFKTLNLSTVVVCDLPGALLSSLSHRLPSTAGELSFFFLSSLMCRFSVFSEYTLVFSHSLQLQSLGI